MPHVKPTTLLIVIVLLGGCRPSDDADIAEGPVLTDTVAIVDGAVVDSVSTDTLAASPQPSAETEPDLVATRLDRLLTEVRELRQSVGELQQASSTAVAKADTGRVSARVKGKETVEDVRNFGLRSFWAILLMAATFFLIKFTVWVLERLSERSARRRLFFKKLIPVIRILIWTAVVYYVISGVFEVDREGLLAAGAAVGVAVGFAAQDVLKNIFGGILIILDQPFQVGDRVSVGGTYGEVVSIGLRSTRIVTPDDNLVTVPNTQVVDGQVANANAGALDCQVVTTLYLPGWVDVSKAKEIAYDAAANSKFVFLKKPIVVFIQDDFKETFLTKVIIKAYVIDARYEGAFASDVTETAKMQYLREGMLVEFIPGATDIAGSNGGDASVAEDGRRL